MVVQRLRNKGAGEKLFTGTNLKLVDKEVLEF